MKITVLYPFWTSYSRDVGHIRRFNSFIKYLSKFIEDEKNKDIDKIDLTIIIPRAIVLREGDLFKKIFRGSDRLICYDVGPIKIKEKLKKMSVINTLLNTFNRYILRNSFYELSVHPEKSDILIANGCERHILRSFKEGNAKIKIYLSNNFESEFKRSKTYFYLEKEMLKVADFILTTSYRDAMKYIYLMGAEEDKVKVFCNLLPTKDEIMYLFKKIFQNREDVINIIIPRADLRRINVFIDFVKKISRYLNIRLFAGKRKIFFEKLLKDIDNIDIVGLIREYSDFIVELSKARFSINFAKNIGGTNIKMYDYLLAGTIVLSSPEGLRGDVFPNSYPFIDVEDLLSKIYLLEWSKKIVIRNYKFLLERAELNESTIKEIFRNI